MNNNEDFLVEMTKRKAVLEELGPYVKYYSDQGVDYAKLIIRNLFLFNGGALLLVPTLFSSIDGIGVDSLIYATRCFIVGVICVGVAAYAAHLNFLYLATIFQNSLDHRLRSISSTNDNHPEVGVSSLINLKIVSVSFLISHLAGLLSFISLFIGAWSIAGAIK
jgi:hypothetical protein